MGVGDDLQVVPRAAWPEGPALRTLPFAARESVNREVQRPHAACPTTYQSTMTEKGTPSIHATM
jgi:hypothetical protein